MSIATITYPKPISAKEIGLIQRIIGIVSIIIGTIILIGTGRIIEEKE